MPETAPSGTPAAVANRVARLHEISAVADGQALTSLGVTAYEVCALEIMERADALLKSVLGHRDEGGPLDEELLVGIAGRCLAWLEASDADPSL